MNRFITITGIGAQNPGKSLVNVGDKVKLVKDFGNPADVHAIKVLYNDMSVGYVGNSAGTVVIGTESASSVYYSLMAPETYAEITGIKEVSFKTRKSKAFVARILVTENKKDEVLKMASKITFSLQGGMSGTYKEGKTMLFNAIKAGLRPIIELEESGSKIEATYEGIVCGFVDEASTDLVKSLMEDKAVATVVSINGTNFDCEYQANDEKLARVKKAKSLKSVMKSIVSEGMDTKENVDAKYEYMKKCSVGEHVMVNVFSSYVKYPDEVERKVPNKPKTLFQDNNGLVSKTIAYMNVKRNLNFEGDKGVGKNVLAETLAWLFKRPLYEFSLNSQHDNSSLLGGNTFAEATEEPKEESIGFAKNFLSIAKGFFGFKTKDTMDAEEFSHVFKKFIGYFTGKKLKYDKSAIVEAAEYGGVLVLDEFNMSLPHVMALFNSMLDDRRRLNVPGYKAFDVHVNFIAIATQNVGYRGTFATNEATSERFVPIIFPQLISIEEVLMAKIPGISYETVKKCQEVFKGIKDKVDKRELEPSAITIRGFIDACLVTEQGLPLKDAMVDNLVNRVADSLDRAKILQVIDVIVL